MWQFLEWVLGLSTSKARTAKLLFSDVDGSIVHYPKALEEWGSLSDHPDENGHLPYRDNVCSSWLAHHPNHSQMFGALCF